MKKQSFIDSISVKEPCSEKWDEMTGNDQVRFCSHCAKSVNDLSAITRKEAMRIVQKSGGNICVRYAMNPRTGGPVFRGSLHQITRRAPLMAAGVMTASLGLSTLTYAQGGAVGLEIQSSPAAVKECIDGVEKAGETAKSVQQGSASISGVVRDTNEAVIVGAAVKLFDANNSPIAETRSDNIGEFRFAGIAPGSYTLIFNAPGFMEKFAPGIELADGEENTQVLTLEVGHMIIMGASIVVTEEYKNPLTIAIRNEDPEEVLDLIVKGANVNGREDDRSTPLFAAVETGDAGLVRILLENGAKINARNKEKETALFKLDEDSTAEIVETLVVYGANLNAVSKDGTTPLIHAAASADAKVIKALVDAGAAVNARNSSGRTALMNAAEKEDLESVRLLILAGADVNAKDNEGESAWDLTVTQEIEDLLVSHGAEVEESEEEPAEPLPPA